jgi:hypothetical protein
MNFELPFKRPGPKKPKIDKVETATDEDAKNMGKSADVDAIDSDLEMEEAGGSGAADSDLESEPDSPTPTKKAKKTARTMNGKSINSFFETEASVSKSKKKKADDSDDEEDEDVPNEEDLAFIAPEEEDEGDEDYVVDEDEEEDEDEDDEAEEVTPEEELAEQGDDPELSYDVYTDPKNAVRRMGNRRFTLYCVPTAVICIPEDENLSKVLSADKARTYLLTGPEKAPTAFRYDLVGYYSPDTRLTSNGSSVGDDKGYLEMMVAIVRDASNRAVFKVPMSTYKDITDTVIRQLRKQCADNGDPKSEEDIYEMIHQNNNRRKMKRASVGGKITERKVPIIPDRVYYAWRKETHGTELPKFLLEEENRRRERQKKRSSAAAMAADDEEDEPSKKKSKASSGKVVKKKKTKTEKSPPPTKKKKKVSKKRKAIESDSEDDDDYSGQMSKAKTEVDEDSDVEIVDTKPKPQAKKPVKKKAKKVSKTGVKVAAAAQAASSDASLPRGMNTWPANSELGRELMPKLNAINKQVITEARGVQAAFAKLVRSRPPDMEENIRRMTSRNVPTSELDAARAARAVMNKKTSARQLRDILLVQMLAHSPYIRTLQKELSEHRDPEPEEEDVEEEDDLDW